MQNRLRILFVTNNYTPYSGGVVSSINAFADELRQQGNAVFIVTLNFLGAQHKDPSYVFRMPCPIKFLYKNNHMALPLRAYSHMKQLVRELRPDIIHSHHPFLLGKTAVRVAQEFSIPIIFTHHSLYDYWSYIVPLPSVVTCPFIRAYVKRYCGQVNGIIAPSKAIKEYLLQQGIKTPIVVIPSGLQGSFLPAVEFKVKKPVVHCHFHLLSVSRFSEEKNVSFLVKLIAELIKENQHYRMTLVGYGQLWKCMKEYAYRQLGLTSERLRFIHRPPREQLVQIYREADLFVFSSQADTQGLVLAEAMAAGVPVIALDGPGQRDIIRQGKNGFIVYSMQEMIDLIRKLAQKNSDLKQMHYSAWQTARRYKTSCLTTHLIKFYKQIIKTH